MLNIFVCGFAGIDGQEDMKHICGIIVVEERDKLVKEDKVYSYVLDIYLATPLLFIYFHLFISVIFKAINTLDLALLY